jgi:Uma2 family endonuclease
MQRADPLPFELPPTQDELPYDDGEPMETPKHRAQMNLLIETLRGAFPQPEVFIGGNMALYYSVLQARNQDFKAPDFFVVLDAIPDRERKSWVMWEENGKGPDVVIELLSDSTGREDRGRKREIYQGLKVWQYYLFDPETCVLEGFAQAGSFGFAPIPVEADGALPCERLGLRLRVREGTFQGRTTRWLRWESPDGVVLPTGEERAREEKARAEQEKARADAAEARLAELTARLRALGLEP